MKRGLLFIASLLAALVAYALVARAISRPDILPPLEDIGDAFTAILGPGIRTTPAVDAWTLVVVVEAQHHHHHTSYQVVFFFKQKTAYEIMCDWSSDVCS